MNYYLCELINPQHNKIQKATELNILHVTCLYICKANKTKAIKLLSKAMYNQYWYSTDYALEALMYATYKIIHPRARQTIDSLSKHIKNHDLALQDTLKPYIFEQEQPIMYMLYNSFLARYIASAWLSMFGREKRLFGVETKNGAHYKIIKAKHLNYLLQGTLQQDNKMHLPRFKGYKASILNQKQWLTSWLYYSKCIPILWD